ncbi:transferrin-binding protein-like solute binding protein [Lonepinella sp. MS14435]|uniref:transferrin-binding protein-like solute binding protein n=1 Tax=unclassified Lonepinella TaxID=2642006 RepID=UPI0036DCD41A
MNIPKVSSLILTSVLVAACSGGGGGAGTATTPDGTKIDLSTSPKGSVIADTVNGILLGQNNNDSFYGVWRNDEQNYKELRYQGTKATDIPKSGIATYKGDAVWISGYDSGFKQGGTTTVNVDFSNKTVEGEITFSILNGDEFRRDITLHKTNLNGAEFQGQASVALNDGGVYKGALFGEQAKEVAGYVNFQNNSNLDVSFGGVKQ